MTQPFTEFQVGARTAPLGLRFWDPRTASFVGDGLRVVAYPLAAPARRVQAAANPSRVWVFHGLPGIDTTFTHGAGDDAFWATPAKQRSYVIEVDDTLARFLPFSLPVDAPLRDALSWPLPAGFTVTGMPPGAVPLFSRPDRSVTPGFTAIRADLWDAAANAPAAWALVTAKVGGLTTAQALSDARGSVALVLPYPAPVGAGPDGLTAVRLTDQTWSVELSLAYAPAAPVPERAALPAALTQAAGSLWETWDEADATKRVKLGAGTLTLLYGEELVVRTARGKAGVLYVTGP